MSLYPIIWAVEHAPVRDAEERAVLVALVSKGDFDGCNCYRSYPTLARIARIDPKTAGRKCRAMEGRGLLRRQTGPMPEGWKRLPKDKRPVVWEVMIPADFWSAAQLEEINQQRRERGRPPIDSANRPPLPEAPPKVARSDKGKERPERRKERGDSQSRRSGESGGTESPVAGGLKVPSRGDSQSTDLPRSPSEEPSSSYVARVTAVSSVAQAQEEEGTPEGTNDQNAAAVVNEAVRAWVGHRPPTQAERARLVERAAAAMAAGATSDGVRWALTRDLAPGQVRTTAVQVVMGRTRHPGWADEAPAVRVSSRPPHCGTCHEGTRMREDDDGRPYRCPDCHPLGGMPVRAAPIADDRVVYDVINLDELDGLDDESAAVIPLARHEQ